MLKRHWTVWALALLFFVAARGVGAPPMPRLAAWVEVNTAKQAVVDDAAKGITAWGDSGAVSTIIVSTVPGNEQIFETLVPVCRAAHMTLIPGIKTASAMPEVPGADGQSYRKFDDYGAWLTIGDSVAQASRVAQSAVVLLENETAVRGFVFGQVELDVARLRMALRNLPQGIEVLWYPTVTSGEADRQARQRDLMWVVLSEHPDVVFVDNSIDREATYNADSIRRNRAYLDTLNEAFYRGARRPLFRMLYCYGPGSRWWQDETLVPLIIGPVGSENWVILYPGASRWSEAAEHIGGLLRIAFEPER